MSAIPGTRFNITGASGSQGLLSPKSSWRVFVLPRGGYASQDSTGQTITFDSADIAGRFAANDWIQVGISVANIRQVSAVGGNSLTVTGSNVTVSENDRVFIIGSTQPTVTGGSATYGGPATFIYQRDDDTSDRFTNSMITSNADGLIQFFSLPAVYDALVQDGNHTNQGSLIDIPVGLAEGISTTQASVFGATVTFNGPTIFNDTMDSVAPFYLHIANANNAAFGVTGVATFNSRVQFGASFAVDGAIGVTGRATFGTSVVINGQLGVTGNALVGGTLTVNGALGVTGNVTLLGASITSTLVSIGSTLTVAGPATFSGALSLHSQPRMRASKGTSQSLNDNTSTFITWSSEIFDVGGMFDLANGWITVPAGQSGTYLIEAALQFEASAVGVRELQIRKNGTISTESSRERSMDVSGTTGTIVSGTLIVPLAVGDTVGVYGLQSSGGALRVVNTGFSVAGYGAEGTRFTAIKIA